MTKKERVLAVMKKEQVDMIPAGFWFHYKSDYTVQQMIDEHMKLFRTTDMDIIKIMQDYPYPISGKITCADDWYHIQVKGTDSEEFAKMAEIIRGISEEGLRNHYGAEVGRTLLRAYGDDVKVRARAKAAAGSDARMNGCSMPVVINSGSGNQGMTCSLPVIEYARELNVPKEKMYRALVVSNLVAIHQKNYIGSLSAYCGAVSAACGAGAAISWLNGGDYNAISKTITNALANTSGIVCDGAKSSCAAKIASAVDAAIMAYALEDADHCFQAGEGLVRDNVEDTIRNMGYVGRVGMKDTDVTILNLMINQKKV